MKHIYTCLLAIFIAHHLSAQDNKTVTAAMNKVKVEFTLDQGHPTYAVYFNNEPVIKRSKLGILLSDNENLTNDFEVLGVDKKQVDETWKPVWGEVSHIRNHYEQATIRLQQHGTHRLMNIVFKVF